MFGMVRDKQIFTRVTQETYDYVTGISEGAGMSRGQVTSLLLDKAREEGWTIRPGHVATNSEEGL